MPRTSKPLGTVKIPRQPRRGTEVLSWCKQAQRAIEDLTGRIGFRPTNAQRPRTFPPLWVKLFYSTANAQWEIAVTPGAVRYHNMGKNPDTDGPTHYLVPTLNGTALDAATPPTAAITQPYIYVKVDTDNKGVPTGTPTIEQKASATASTHHRPADPDDATGEDGEYYFLIAKATQDGSRWSMDKRLPGNLNIPNQLVEQENVGYGAKPYKGYLPDAADVHQFRSLVERASGTVAINVDEETNEIRIHGTGVDDTVVFTDVCGATVTMVVADGLITSISRA